MLRDEMNKLVRHTERAYRALCDLNRETARDSHGVLCAALADQFDLWDKEDRFPAWLSRVVAGVMADVDESTPSPAGWDTVETSTEETASTLRPIVDA